MTQPDTEFHDFEIDGVMFRQLPLDPMRAQHLLIQCLQPIGLGLTKVEHKTPVAIIGGLASAGGALGPQLTVLVEALASRCQYAHARNPDGSAVWLPLGDPNKPGSAFARVFTRKGTVLWSWISECVAWEYEDFLRATTPLLVAAKANLSSWVKNYAKNGGFGASPSTGGSEPTPAPYTEAGGGLESSEPTST